MNRFYYASVAPVIIKNQVIAGVSGDDMDNPGYLQAHDPVTGEMKWRFYTVPQKTGDPGSDTWPNEEVMKHGGGMTWHAGHLRPGSESDLSSRPAIRSRSSRTRTAPGDNLFTGSIVALNADTGKMVVVFPVLAARHSRLGRDADAGRSSTATIDGQPRKLHRAGRAQRPFLRARPHQRQGDRLDRVREDQLVARLRRSGPADPESGEDAADRRRARVAEPGRRGQLAVADASARRPGCSTSTPTRAFSVYYIYDPSDNPAGWGGIDRGGYSESMLQAIDYKTGKIRWSHPWKSGGIDRAAEHGRQPGVHRRIGRTRGARRHDRRALGIPASARSPTRRSPTSWTANSTSSLRRATTCSRS